MKIIFTTKGPDWNSPIDPRFGRTEMFLIYDEENDKFEKVLNNEVEVMGHGAGLQTSKKVLALDSNIIITGNGAGGKALEIIKETDIKMYIGAGDMTVKEAYEAYKSGQLKTQF